MRLRRVPDVLGHDPIRDGLRVEQRGRFVLSRLAGRVATRGRRVWRDGVVVAIVVPGRKVEVPVQAGDEC